MTETPPTPPVEDEEYEAKVRRTYTMATQRLREQHLNEFNTLRVAAAKELGIEWQPRASKLEKAQVELDRLLAENPDLLSLLAERVAEADAT